ncbi:MAG: hypothetical protein V4649_02895 [Bacteroidota bacterium]
MPCHHKFQNELNLELLDYQPTTLVVGTFEPELPAGNTAGWFYGRTADDCFWDVLPRLYGQTSLLDATPEAWRQFCREHKIALTDLISSIDDADPGNVTDAKILGGFSDKAIVYNFDDLTFVNIVQLLGGHPTIRNVYITRGITEAFWRHLWNPAAQYCNANGLHERRLLNTSEDSSYQHQAYNEAHPESPIRLPADYILMRWREQWHF